MTLFIYFFMSVVELAWNTSPTETSATVLTLIASHEAEH